MIPCTTPELFTVALPLLAVQVPPPASVSAVVSPIHTESAPVIGDGNGLTVTMVMAIQPVEAVYVTEPVPADTPVTTPEVADTDICALVLLHVPPPVAELNVVLRPTHTESIPDIAEGAGSIVTTTLLRHPVAVIL